MAVLAASLNAAQRRQATPAPLPRAPRRRPNAPADAARVQRRAQANANSRAKFLNAINKVKNIIRLTGQSQEYLTLTNAIRNFSNTRGNNATLNAKANAIFRAYGALPGGAAALGPRTKLKVARKLQSLSKIYSNRHGNALYEAGLRYGTPANPFGMVLRSVARRLA
jgi:hypothetical protein